MHRENLKVRRVRNAIVPFTEVSDPQTGELIRREGLSDEIVEDLKDTLMARFKSRADAVDELNQKDAQKRAEGV